MIFRKHSINFHSANIKISITATDLFQKLPAISLCAASGSLCLRGE
jgi:hypothetical protein